jgi:putative ABC transport system permease protein
MLHLRDAFRSFRREPGFVAAVVVTFALAIGVNVAMLGLVERLMLSAPPGVERAERVMRIGLRFQGGEREPHTVSATSFPVFEALHGLDRGFENVAAARSATAAVGRGAELVEVSIVAASGEFFATLGVRPQLGRLFGPEDDRLPGGDDVVVLGDSYWRRSFGADRSVVGRELVVDGRPLTVIGVTPRGFHGVELAATDLFLPLATAMRAQPAGWWANPGMRVVSVVARLREGVSADAAAGMATAALRDDSFDLSHMGFTSAALDSLVPGRSSRGSAQARVTLWLSGVAFMVLLVATANAGTLLLLRARRRRRELAVRLALGAGFARLLRQSLVESLLLSLSGAALGLLLSRLIGDVVRTVLIPDLAAPEGLGGRWAFVASILLACAAGLAAGLSPLAQLRGRNVSLDLHAGGGHGATSRFASQRVLVGVQVALTVVLLYGAGLFVKSLERVRSQDLGFSTARLLHVELDHRGRLRGAERDRAHEEAVERLRRIPGVTAATVVQGMPFSSHHIPPIDIPGYVLPSPTVQQVPILYGATPEYLAMMGVTPREGRLFTERDGRGTPLVVLVNETMARTAWPGRSPLGQCVRAGHGPPPTMSAASLPCREVVGVVRDSRARSLRAEGGEDELMQYYVPFAQLPPVPAPGASTVHGLLVQTAGDPERLVAAVRRLLQSASAVPVHARVRPYQELLDPQLRPWRLGATLFSAFGALAVGIAALGLFAVVSYLVAQRTREIGVRLALGGTAAAIARLVVSGALRMVLAGAAVGLLAALVTAPLARSMLFQTPPRDLSSVLLACGTLLLVALASAAWPAYRASRLSPMTVLRTET